MRETELLTLLNQKLMNKWKKQQKIWVRKISWKNKGLLFKGKRRTDYFYDINAKYLLKKLKFIKS